MFEEEPAYIFGVPFEVVPFKAVSGTPKPRAPQRRIHAVPAKARFAITVPRVKGYSQGISNKVSIPDWVGVPRVVLDPKVIPSEAQMAAALNAGRPSIHAPGGVLDAALQEFRTQNREQSLVFQMSRDLTRMYVEQPSCEAPAHVLFPQMVQIVQRYLVEKVDPEPPAQRIDAFLSPYYGWIVERLAGGIRPDTAQGEAAEIPDIERDRACATADIDVWSGKEVREALKTHVNLVINDTKVWEQSAAYLLDTHPGVEAFIKNAGLNFTIPYAHNGEPHDYLPDFVARRAGEAERVTPASQVVMEASSQ